MESNQRKTIEAKQRASVLWLLSKAYSNKIPSDLIEPFYKDHDDNDRLKPQIVQALASAELYCLALANMYSDPNYHCLNHYGIMQILQRKGVYMVEPNDTSLTETVLIQNAPIKMSAHMVIIEAIMTLYIKEVLIPEKVAEVVSRFSYLEEDEIPEDLEEVAIFWINKCCVRLKQIMQRELNEDESTRSEPMPSLPMLEELTDLSDGCCLAALLSFYCPDHLKWQDIALNKDLSLADSIYNLQLVQFFCEEKLPYNCCFLTIEDFLYLHETIQTNVLAFIADLLYLFEIRPADCVRLPAMEDELDESDIHNGLHYPDLPTPAEMKAKSLQHQSWVDENQLCEQTSNGSTPNRTPRRSVSRATLNNQNNSRQQKSVSSHQPSDEDEELTRYFSTIDLKTENEMTPEIIMINDRTVDSTLQKTGPKSMSINTFSNITNRRNSYRECDVSTGSNPKDVILSNSPGRESDTYKDHTISAKSSSQLADYFSQLAQNNSSAAQRTSSAPNPRRGSAKHNQQMNSSIILGTESPPLVQTSSASSVSATTSFGKLNTSASKPLLVESEPAINIAYLHKSDKTSNVSNNNPQASQPSPPIAANPLANKTNTMTFRKFNLSNSSSNMSSGGDQPFYLQEDQTDAYQRPQPMAPFNSQISKSDSIDSLLEDSENNISRDETNSIDTEIASQVHNIRMKLEEKRRKIELERLSAEEQWKSSRQNIGKEAFLRVIHKNPEPVTGNQEVNNILQNHPHNVLPPQMINNHQILNQEVLHPSNQQMMSQMNHQFNHQMPPMQPQMNQQINHQINHQMIAPQQMMGHPILNQQNMNNHMMNNQFNHQIMNNQMNAPDVMAHHMPQQQQIPGQQYYPMPHQMVGQNANSFFISSQPRNSAEMSIPQQQVFEEYERQQNQMYNTANGNSKHNIGRTFRVMKPKVIPDMPDMSEQSSPIKSSASQYSDEGFHNYENDNKSSSSGSKQESTVEETNYQTESFFISFGNDSKPKTVKPGLKPKHVKQQQQMRRELKNAALSAQEKESAEAHPPDSTNGTPPRKTSINGSNNSLNSVSPGVGFVIGADLVHPDPSSEQEMTKKKESIMLASLKRRERQEAERIKREQNLAQKREEERLRREMSERKKEEEKIKRQLILEQYRQRKAAEDAEKSGSISSKDSVRSNSTLNLNRPSRQRLFQKPRPKSLYVSPSNIQDYSSLDCNKSRIVDDTDACLMSSASNLSRPESAMSGQSKSYVSSPTQSHPSNLPFMFSRSRGPPSECASETGSTFASSTYTGPKLFVKPSQKSNKTLILNAINVVLAGAVNIETKKKVLEHINGSESKHFLILFRNAGLQFRGIYTYNPDREEVLKLFGTGPKSVTNEVIERFYKYNSGSKSFTEIQTKHLSVTIDAIVIDNNLWTGKRVIPKKDYL